MAAKKKYLLALNLGLLGFGILLSLFETSRGKEHFLGKSINPKHYIFSVGNLEENDKILSSRKLEQNEVTSLTLKIFADKQYDYDQNIYLAEGNVKALINGGILRADLLSYDKSTGILSAEGNIRFRKGGQYFRAKEFKFNLLKKEGSIKDAYGILDLKNVVNDLKIDAISNQAKPLNSTNDKEINTYDDGIEFSFGNIKLPENKITRSNKSIGLINNWRFKSKLIKINQNGWKSNRINFTNDPFDPHQISFEGIDVIAEEVKEGKLLITSSKTNLILGNRNLSLGKRIFGEKTNTKFRFIYDGKDRDGLTLLRKSDITKINNHIELEFQPQFLISRSLLGKTNSYDEKDSKSINFSDLFGLNIKVSSIYKNWKFESLNDLSTLKSKRIFSGLRHSSSLKKYFKLPILDDSSFNIFTTYRSRAWNGTIGETEIKSAYGGFLEKNNSFKYGKFKNNLNLRFGTARYEAEKLENSKIISLWRSSSFASLDSEYQIWKIDRKKVDLTRELILSPVLIYPELVLRTNINTAYFKYENGSSQGFIKLSFGPEIRLGKLERNFLDYTKLSVMPGFKIKTGNSPFKFDNAIDLKTLNIGFMQQIYGPILFDIDSNLNIDNSSENYGEYYDTKLGLLYHKRAYEYGIYYHPNDDAGGIYFRINGFKFGNSTKAVF